MDAKYRIVAADLGDPEHCAGLVHCLDQYAADPMGRVEGLPPEVQRDGLEVRVLQRDRGVIDPTALTREAQAQGPNPQR